MVRASILLLAFTLASFAQTVPNAQIQANAAQSLIELLRGDVVRYKPGHPQVKESEALIGILETQTKLLRQPVAERDETLVAHQIRALTEQVGSLRHDLTGYRPDHPDVTRKQALIKALTEQRQSITAVARTSP